MGKRPPSKLEAALRKATKCKLPPVGKLCAEDADAIDARANLGLRTVKQMDDVLGLLRTRPAKGGIEGRLDEARVSRRIGAREIASTSEPSAGLWARLAGISACAWRDVQLAEEDANEAHRQVAEEDAFRELYMQIITDGLAGELDQIREKEQLGAESVDALVSALETGADTFLPFERSLVAHSFADR
ncbi:hypothetical protein KFE25_000553 [Diacronema lutheri]|uniref:Ribosome-assembly protein 3 C-terminal domain-containing protein n=2 Tax=Diacronema lutheri TaxID=2081491 RepID=A0A8J5XRU3_DIALT|nr:hypothetical protein KFE25_000553 [Diacronema lutheri]